MPDDLGAVGIAEPVSAEGTTEAVDTSVESVESGGEVTETGNESESSPEKEGLTGTQAPKGKLNLADVVKKSADALKAINPALPAALRTAAFELGSLYREFPGGLKEAVQAKQALGEIGGAEGIKEAQEAIGDYSRLESLFEKGDPAFMERLAEALPQSFSQIMPAGLEKWKQADPEMYNHVQARVMIQTLDSANVSNTLETIWSNLDEATQKPLKDAVAKIWQTIDGYRQAGAKAPERKGPSPEEQRIADREQKVAAQEQRALLTPVANEGRQQIQSITDREMNASYQWNATDPDIKSAVSERVRLEVINASSKDKSFTTEFERLKDRGDSSGLSRHVKNFQDRVTPAIVQRVARLFAVKPKGAGTVVKKPIAAVNGNGSAKPEQGWVRISAQPSAREINYGAMGRSAEDMIMGGKAILKDGRKVQWA